MKKKQLRKQIRRLEQDIVARKSREFFKARLIATQILTVSAKPMPEGCDRLCTAVVDPFGNFWTAEIRVGGRVRWIDPGGNPDYATSSREAMRA